MQNFLIAIFRMPPLGFFLLALAIGTGGYFLSDFLKGQAEERAKVIAEGPPASANIEDFDPALHSNSAGEVLIRAQADLELRYHLELEGRSGSTHAFMVPLVPTDGSSTEPVAMVFFRVPSGEDINQDFMWDTASGYGTVGPIVKIHGQRGSYGRFSDMVRDAFAEEGRSYPGGDILIIEPFFEDRAVALAYPNIPQVFLGFLGVSAFFALMGAFKFAIRQLSDEEPVVSKPTAAAQMAPLPGGPVQAFESIDPVSELKVPAQAFGENFAKGRDVPEWQQRLMKKQGGTPAEVAIAAAPRVLDNVAPQTENGPVVSHRQGMSLGKVVLVLFGGVFALLVGAVIYGTVLDTMDGGEGGSPTVATVYEGEPAQVGPISGLMAMRLALTSANRNIDTALNRELPAAPAPRASQETESSGFGLTAIEPNSGGSSAMLEAMADVAIAEAFPDTPEAEKGRWDIDFAPIFRWLLSTAVDAMAGDATAMIILTGLGLTVLILPIFVRLLIRNHFAAKRRMAMHGSFSGMGYR